MDILLSSGPATAREHTYTPSATARSLQEAYSEDVLLSARWRGLCTVSTHTLEASFIKAHTF